MIFLAKLILAQSNQIDSVIQVPDRLVTHLEDRLGTMDEALTKHTEKYLRRLSRQEEKIKAQLYKVDSSRTAKLFRDSQKKYDELSQKLGAASGKLDRLTSGDYLAGLDSLQGSLAFLKDAQNIFSKAKDTRGRLGSSLEQANALQHKLKAATEIQGYLQQRQQQIGQILKTYTHLPASVSKSLGKYQQQAYYYATLLQQYKQLLNDPDKLVQQMLAALRHIPAFQKFMGRYSMLSALFPTPDNYGSPESLAGLQTRISVQQTLQQNLGRLGTDNGSNPMAYMRQQIAAAQQELSGIKDKLESGGAGNSGGVSMPENFKPNGQKTRKFLQRIEWSVSFQTQKANNYQPVGTDVSLTAGYKLNDKSIIDIGISGKMGWGNEWKHIRLTGEAVGVRAFAQWKAPDLFGGNSKVLGSLWFTAGAEMHYTRTVESLAVFKNYSNWTKSALAGLTKKYSMNSPLKRGKKMQGTMSVLYDFLYNTHIPPTPAIVWRVGYNF